MPGAGSWIRSVRPLGYTVLHFPSDGHSELTDWTRPNFRIATICPLKLRLAGGTLQCIGARLFYTDYRSNLGVRRCALWLDAEELGGSTIGRD
jgi:hypothetical protein